ncbi:hypothetical protein F4779DRAFT_616522 [Xylariaceae sp. FL0662B]|nr:hypothetical protein F4779DRAFT_616522 [Xylariaceae sp. FL0662B]
MLLSKLFLFSLCGSVFGLAVPETGSKLPGSGLEARNVESIDQVPRGLERRVKNVLENHPIDIGQNIKLKLHGRRLLYQVVQAAHNLYTRPVPPLTEHIKHVLNEAAGQIVNKDPNGMSAGADSFYAGEGEYFYLKIEWATERALISMEQADLLKILLAMYTRLVQSRAMVCQVKITGVDQIVSGRSVLIGLSSI